MQKLIENMYESELNFIDQLVLVEEEDIIQGLDGFDVSNWIMVVL